VERSREKSNMLQGFGDAVLQAEALEDHLLKSWKHAAAMQSKLNAAFAKYHNDIQELLGSCWRSRGSLTRCALLSCRA
jgi:hypothetical protein